MSRVSNAFRPSSHESQEPGTVKKEVLAFCRALMAFRSPGISKKKLFRAVAFAECCMPAGSRCVRGCTAGLAAQQIN